MYTALTDPLLSEPVVKPDVLITVPAADAVVLEQAATLAHVPGHGADVDVAEPRYAAVCDVASVVQNCTPPFAVR